MHCRLTLYSIAIALATFGALKEGAALARDHAIAQISTNLPAYPVRMSANNRYLVDQNNQPFMIVGDSPHSMIGKMSKSDAEFYLTNRAKYGINTLWVNLLCNDREGCNADATTFDGIPPFIVPGDISTPSSAYFNRVDEMVNLAAERGISILLNVVETVGWLATFRANGLEKAESFGKYVGNRYRNFPNIIWMYGNDFQTWEDPYDDAIVLAIAKGVRSADPNHMTTTELSYLTSGSLDDARWEPLIGLDGAYTYFPTYAQVLKEYNRSNFRPVFMEEANYEFEHNPNTDGGSPSNLRRQEYWTMLSGATGQLYGSAYTWKLPSGWLSSWRSKLDTPGAMQLSYMKNLFVPRKWYDLIPDQQHTVVTNGYGTPAAFGTGSVTTDTYAAAARTSDGALVIAYLPTIRAITVDMSKLAGTTVARWYDPSSGNFVNVSGSPVSNTGIREFRPIGQNHVGDGDWVLVLEAQ
jgi:Protein of unknown function (DUF4038)/Putative collagen-binding domain of a collagenase